MSEHSAEKVRIGQVYADNDPRDLDRRLRVAEIENGYARCYAWRESSSASGRMVTVSVSRLQRNNTRGYRLVVPEPLDGGERA